MEKKICIVCGERGLQLCSGCRAVHYCSKEHQKSHWPDHKLYCRPYRIEVDEVIGHHLVASKNFEAGAIILQEEPLVIGMSKLNGSIRCLECCKKLDSLRFVCPNCKWPMCGRKECMGDGSQHALGECAVLKASHSVEDYHAIPVTSKVYISVTVLRCLSLRVRDPLKWEKLIDEKFCGFAPRVKILESSWDRNDVVELVNQWLQKDSVSPELIKKICLATFFKSYELGSTQKEKNEDMFGVYSTAGLLDHSCVPNATHSFTKEGKIVMKAAVPITKGSRITLNNTSCSMSSTLLRQQIIENTKFGLCRCDRCSDPTELGTFTGGIFCLRCPNREGILLSEFPLNQHSDWICIKCSDRKSAKFVNDLLEIAGKDLDALDCNSFKECEAFIRKYEKVFHPNHCVLVEAKMSLYENYPFFIENIHPQTVNEENLIKKETIASELLNVVNILKPGFTRTRGIMLFAFSTVLLVRYEKLNNEDSISAEEALRRVKEIHKVLLEANTIFSWSGAETGDFHFAKASERYLKEVETLLDRVEMQSILFSVD